MQFDFNQSQTVEDINKVPEDFRGLYKEGSDGKYTLNTEDAGVKSAVSAITRLNKSLAAARAEAKAKGEAKPDLSALSEFGETPEDVAKNVQAKIAELTDQLTKGDKNKINVDKIKEDLAKEHAKQTQALTSKNEALTSQLHTLLVENAAVAEITAAKGVPDLLMPFVKSQIKVIEADGKLIPRVVDAQGDIRYSGVTGEPMSIKELVADMKGQEKYGRLFESEQKSGAGTRPGAVTQQPRKEAGERSSVEKIAAGLSKR